MEPIESSETSAYNNTLTPGTYPKENKLQSKHGGSLKSSTFTKVIDKSLFHFRMKFVIVYVDFIVLYLMLLPEP
jgi:hypothetical protein